MYDATYMRNLEESKIKEPAGRKGVARGWRGVGWDKELRSKGYSVSILQAEKSSGNGWW